MSQRGQASLEWLGAVTLLAAVLGAAGLAGAGGGEAVAASVVRGMHRALCVVRGGVCDLDRRPCVVAANGTEDEAHVNLAFIRVGRRELILREHRSDGTVLVTYLHDTGAGADVGVGADAWLNAAGHELAIGSTARAALLVSLGGGETWSFADAREADVAMAYLSEGRAPPMGRRTERISRHGIELAAQAGRSVRGRVAELRLDARVLDGTIVDDDTGRRTHVVSRRAEAGALLRVRRAGGSGEAIGDERISVTTDADGRPLELSVVRTGELRGALSVPDVAQSMVGAMLTTSAGHRRWVVEQRLDLTEPDSLRAAQGLLDTLGGPLAAAARAGDALRARLEEAGVTEARTYDVDGESSGGGAHGALGIKLGGGITDRRDDARLVDARVRGIDGRWRSRDDCLRGGGGGVRSA
jgi:hypothetical protein